MPRMERPRMEEDSKPRPRARIVALAGKKCRQRIASLDEILGTPANRVGAHQRRRSLAKRASPNLLAEVGDPALVVEHDVDSNTTAAHRRPPLDAGLRMREPAMMRNRGREAQDIAVIEGRRHRGDIGAADECRQFTSL